MAYALVTGSTYAMVGAIASMDSAGKSAASTGAGAATPGNVNLGNDSLNNYGANKSNSAVQDVAGVMPRKQYNQEGVKETINPYGTSISGPGIDQYTNNAGISATNKGGQTATGYTDPYLSANETKSAENTVGESLTKAKSNATSLNKGVSTAYNNVRGSSAGLSSNEKKGINWNCNNYLYSKLRILYFISFFILYFY